MDVCSLKAWKMFANLKNPARVRVTVHWFIDYGWLWVEAILQWSSNNRSFISSQSLKTLNLAATLRIYNWHGNGSKYVKIGTAQNGAFDIKGGRPVLLFQVDAKHLGTAPGGFRGSFRSGDTTARWFLLVKRWCWGMKLQHLDMIWHDLFLYQ